MTLETPTRFLPEFELILNCARSSLDDAAKQRIRALASRELDWDAIVSLAHRHRVSALLQRSLHRAGASVTEGVHTVLTEMNRESSMVALWQTRELLHVVRLLEKKELPCMPFKGPLLGSQLYGDPALRPSLDIDFLIRKDDFSEVRQVLVDDGYRPYRTMSARRERKFWETQMGFEMVNDDRTAVVELHWAFLNRVHGYHLDPALVWQRSVTVMLAGRPIRSFSNEDLLQYLCAHGAKSLWSRLSWICDVAELLRKSPDVDWDYLLAQARNLSAERILFLGLRLAHDLLDAPVPPHLHERIYMNDAVERLFEKTVDSLLQIEQDPIDLAARADYHLRMRDRFVDRLPYVMHLLRLAFEPNEEDRDFVPLPEKLTGMYYLLRPVRILRNRFRTLPIDREAGQSDDQPAVHPL